ncbi:hypothetical protein GYA49_00655 [Candidatus Beckwithbacteria bacterium]|nr:hypothetical protein [Candidatus Beckwithbacteria bacterium]
MEEGLLIQDCNISAKIDSPIEINEKPPHLLDFLGLLSELIGQLYRTLYLYKKNGEPSLQEVEKASNACIEIVELNRGLFERHRKEMERITDENIRFIAKFNNQEYENTRKQVIIDRENLEAQLEELEIQFIPRFYWLF